MKTLVFLIATLGLILPASAYAQDGSAEGTTTADISTPNRSNNVSKGVSISLIKDIMDVEAKSKFTDSSKEDADQNFGIGIGYDYIRVKNIGFSVQGVLNTYDNDSASDAKLFRLTGNATVGVNKHLYFYGGINISQIVDAGDGDIKAEGISVDYKPGLGLQAGIAGQINKNFGARLGYGILNNSIELDSPLLGRTVDVDAKFSGLEFALIATF